jgi:hypothetical protein
MAMMTPNRNPHAVQVFLQCANALVLNDRDYLTPYTDPLRIAFIENVYREFYNMVIYIVNHPLNNSDSVLKNIYSLVFIIFLQIGRGKTIAESMLNRN